MISRSQFSVFIIVALAAFLRVYDLGANPPGVFKDEASNAIDANSILKTGRDQHGRYFPLVFESLNDYRESSYIYLSILPVQLFGLNAFSIRLTSAVIGVLTVFLVFLITEKLFGWETAIFAAILLAISPWHVLLSRVGFRAILFPFVFCLGYFSFLKNEGNPGGLWKAALFFGLGLFTYPSARIFIPLFTVALFSIFYRKNKTFSWGMIIAVTLFVSMLIPMAVFWVSPQGMARASQVGIISDPVGAITKTCG
jgi:predicted membrane-bound mannosyltransferase